VQLSYYPFFRVRIQSLLNDFIPFFRGRDKCIFIKVRLYSREYALEAPSNKGKELYAGGRYATATK
jgi:hypothetical protein